MKKKKGATMITVLVLMMTILTVGMVFLSVVLNDFKMSNRNSENVASLYGAESGLETAYNILVKVFDYAVDRANHEVETKFDSNMDLEKSQEEMNELFQSTFIKVFETKESENSQGILQDSINNLTYPVFNPNSQGQSQTRFQSIDFKPEGEIEIEVVQDRDPDNLTFKFLFISTFMKHSMTKEVSERQVSVQYTMKVPHYQGALQQQLVTKTIPNYPVFTDSVVNIDGNADFKGSIDIKGNIRIKGKEKASTSIQSLDSKYENGIIIKDALVKLEGDLMTNETVSLHNQSNVEIDGNIFARNLYIGEFTNETALPTHAELIVQESLLLDNDLVVNPQAALDKKITTKVWMSNLYGLNDKNELKADGTPFRESSSLIINSEGAKVTVKDSTYLSGVAYIDTKDPYQTGESVAVRGNYLVYNRILPGYEGKVQLKYYDPMLLVESIENDSSIQAKAEYFVKSAQDGALTLSTGGVSLNPQDVHTIGAWVSEQQPVGKGQATFSEDEINFLMDKRQEYARQVYNMGMKAEVSDYEKGLVLKSITSGKNGEAQINFDYLRSHPNLEFRNYYGEVIANADENIVIKVEKNEFGTNDIIYVDRQKNNVVKRISDVNKAFIVTAGDVHFVGNVYLIGNVIAGGDLIMEADNSDQDGIQLVYDKKVTQQIIALNYDPFKNLFNRNTEILNQTEVEVVDGATLDKMNTNYYVEDYIAVNNWRLVK